MKTTIKEKDEAVKFLEKLCPPGTTIYTVLRSVSRSGTSRQISLFICNANEIYDITFNVGKVLGYRCGKHYGLIVGGSGMDMGFHLVNRLSYLLHGYEDIKKEAKTEGVEDPFVFRATTKEYRAGYSLEHRWL